MDNLRAARTWAWWKLTFARTLAVSGIIGAMIVGGIVGSWIGHDRFPLSVRERTVITPKVQPGGFLQVRLKVDRIEQCSITAQRYLAFSDGTRWPLVQEYAAGFGRLGGDEYTISIQVPAIAPKGPAYMWSRGAASCNPIEMIWPQASGEWTDHFEVATE